MNNENAFIGDCPAQTLRNLAGAGALVQAAACAQERGELAEAGTHGLWLLGSAIVGAAAHDLEKVGEGLTCL